jgi:hypothetical protein
MRLIVALKNNYSRKCSKSGTQRTNSQGTAQFVDFSVYQGVRSAVLVPWICASATIVETLPCYEISFHYQLEALSDSREYALHFGDEC